MRILWASATVQGGSVGRPRWEPRIEAVRKLASGTFPCVWVITDPFRSGPWAIGVADVTVAQQTAIDADGSIQWVGESQWGNPLSTLNPPSRNAISNFVTRAGLPAPANTDTLAAIFNSVLASYSTDTITSLSARMMRDWGV